MFKRYTVPALTVALAAIAGYNTPVFGHGNSSSTTAYEEVGRGTVLSSLGELPDQGTFVNYETPHVHPLDISPNGQWLAVVNTADGYVEIFFIIQSGGSAGEIQHHESIKVGIDPVSARWRSNDELWVVNQISDSISIVDRPSGTVKDTIITYRLQDPGSGLLEGDPNGDEPADVVFNAANSKAYVSCSRTDYIQEWDLATLTLDNEIYIDGEEPRALDIHNNNVYAAIFESGNGTTLIFGESAGNSASTAMPPNTAILNANNRTDHPYYWDSATDQGYGVNALYPPPNDGTLGPFDHDVTLGSYVTPHGTVNIRDLDLADKDCYELDTSGSLCDDTAHGVGNWDNLTTERYFFPPPTSMIVRRDYSVNAFDPGAWVDDNGGDWTAWVSGIDDDYDGIYEPGDGDVDYTEESGRVFGWDLLDNDIGILNVATPGSPTVSGYATELMNICMALGVKKAGTNPGNVYMVGTEATNEVRFEPNLTGTFVRSMLSVTDGSGAQVALIDLNKAHLDAAQTAQHSTSTDAYADGSVPQSERNKSIGDPRGIAFTPDCATVYISGMGSNNVLALDTSDVEAEAADPRYSAGHTIEVGFGPTGLKHHGTLERLYVVNKFDASVSVIDTTTAGSESVLQTLEFHDSTPDFINEGRVHFYGTHENSGLGQLACAACHVDGRMDRLAWDLGNPAALVDGSDDLLSPVDTDFTDILGRGDGLKLSGDNQDALPANSVFMNTLVFDGSSGTNIESGFEKFHPMKGPMTTQTLQDIIGKEPHHWRGDKRGIEEFAGAFDGLQGADAPLASTPMQEFENFLSSIHFPPNPFRPIDNTLPGGPNRDGGSNPNLHMTNLYTAPPGTGHVDEVMSASGTPMQTAVPTGGDAWNGFKMYVDFRADSTFRCVDCHTLPIGAGPIAAMPTDRIPFLTGGSTVIPPGAAGEAHQMVVALDATGQPHMKVPQTRNQYDKEGMYLNQMANVNGPAKSRAGFGVLHDGAIDGLVRFLSEPAFDQINRTGDNQPDPTNAGHDGSIQGAQGVTITVTNNAATDDEMVADIVAFTLAIGGADFDQLTLESDAPDTAIPPAADDQTGHSGVGYSITIDSAPAGSSDDENLIYSMTRRANDGDLGLIAYGWKDAERRYWVHDSSEDGTTVFQSDRDGETIGIASLLALAGTGTELSFMLVDPETEGRVGLDRDEDGLYNGDETTHGSDPANADSDGDGLTDGDEVNVYSTEPDDADSDDDGINDNVEIDFGLDPNVSNPIVFTNFSALSDGDGSYDSPFNLFSSALSGVPASGSIWMNGGVTTTNQNFTGTISDAVTLDSFDGSVSLGN